MSSTIANDFKKNPVTSRFLKCSKLPRKEKKIPKWHKIISGSQNNSFFCVGINSEYLHLCHRETAFLFKSDHSLLL